MTQTKFTEDYIQLLVSTGNINTPNMQGQTPVIEAVIATPHNIQPILNLLEAGADVNATDAEGNTLLHHLAGLNEYILYATLVDGSKQRFTISLNDILHCNVADQLRYSNVVELNEAILQLTGLERDTVSSLELYKIPFHRLISHILERNPDLTLRNTENYTAFQWSILTQNRNIFRTLYRHTHITEEEHAIALTTKEGPFKRRAITVIEKALQTTLQQAIYHQDLTGFITLIFDENYVITEEDRTFIDNTPSINSDITECMKCILTYLQYHPKDVLQPLVRRFIQGKTGNLANEVIYLQELIQYLHTHPLSSLSSLEVSLLHKDFAQFIHLLETVDTIPATLQPLCNKLIMGYLQDPAQQSTASGSDAQSRDTAEEHRKFFYSEIEQLFPILLEAQAADTSSLARPKIEDATKQQFGIALGDTSPATTVSSGSKDAVSSTEKEEELGSDYDFVTASHNDNTDIQEDVGSPSIPQDNEHPTASIISSWQAKVKPSLVVAYEHAAIEHQKAEARAAKQGAMLPAIVHLDKLDAKDAKWAYISDRLLETFFHASKKRKKARSVHYDTAGEIDLTRARRAAQSGDIKIRKRRRKRAGTVTAEAASSATITAGDHLWQKIAPKIGKSGILQAPELDTILVSDALCQLLLDALQQDASKGRIPVSHMKDDYPFVEILIDRIKKSPDIEQLTADTELLKRWAQEQLFELRSSAIVTAISLLQSQLENNLKRVFNGTEQLHSLLEASDRVVQRFTQPLLYKALRNPVIIAQSIIDPESFNKAIRDKLRLGFGQLVTMTANDEFAFFLEGKQPTIEELAVWQAIFDDQSLSIRKVRDSLTNRVIRLHNIISGVSEEDKIALCTIIGELLQTEIQPDHLPTASELQSIIEVSSYCRRGVKGDEIFTLLSEACSHITLSQDLVTLYKAQPNLQLSDHIKASFATIRKISDQQVDWDFDKRSSGSASQSTDGSTDGQVAPGR